MVGGRFALRACIVNFRTSLADIEALPPLLARLGREADQAMRAKPAPQPRLSPQQPSFGSRFSLPFRLAA